MSNVPMLLIAGLFVSLFIAFYLIFVPLGVQYTSPAGITIDSLRRRLELRLTTGKKGEILNTLEKEKSEIIKQVLFSCLGTAGVILLIGIKPLGIWALIPSVVLSILVLYGFEWVLQNEFNNWQAKIYKGIPTLVDFLPAFFSVGSITPLQAIKSTIPFLEDPLRREMWEVWNRIAMDGDIDEAFDKLARKTKHPLMDAICSRLTSVWKSGIADANIFTDLSDQIDEIEDEIAKKATLTKVIYLSLLTLLGLIACIFIFLYPFGQIFFESITGVF